MKYSLSFICFLSNLHEINTWWNRSSSHHFWMSVYFKRIIRVFILLILWFFYHLATPIRHHFINRSILLWKTKVRALWLDVCILIHNSCCVLRWSVIVYSDHIATSWWLALIITQFIRNSNHLATLLRLTLIIGNSLNIASCTSLTPSIRNSDKLTLTTNWCWIIGNLLIDFKKLAGLFRSYDRLNLSNYLWK